MKETRSSDAKVLFWQHMNRHGIIWAFFAVPYVAYTLTESFWVTGVAVILATLLTMRSWDIAREARRQERLEENEWWDRYERSRDVLVKLAENSPAAKDADEIADAKTQLDQLIISAFRNRSPSGWQ